MVQTEKGEEAVFPRFVLSDLGANCNLLTKVFLARTGAKLHIVPGGRRVHTSVGTTSPAEGMVVADLVFAAGTEDELRLPRQPFLVVESTLYAVLLGTRSTALGAGRAHVDGQDWRFHYTTEAGKRASLPMMVVAECKERPAGAASASSAVAGELSYPVIPDEDMTHAFTVAVQDSHLLYPTEDGTQQVAPPDRF